ncbi:MAG: InlB B-repeat-containing protein [Clostridiaceae bacterium]|jgi:uncharacterized repeat protein (TIGR02543 family)|nr:InlB B-repeat-containing protein [Clostridiaceae bacterium]
MGKRTFKSKIFFAAAALILALTTALTLAACSDGKSEYTVIFNANGETVHTATVPAGGLAESFAAERDGAELAYWADATGNRYDFATPVNGDLTLNARWQFAVSFSAIAGGQSVFFDIVRVLENAAVVKPADPSVAGHTFNGWKKPGTTEFYDFGTPVTAAFELYADLTPDALTVAFKDGQGNALAATVGVPYGGKVQAPGAPAIENYTFIGWIREGADTSFDFSAPVTASVVLIATYAENSFKTLTVKGYTQGSPSALTVLAQYKVYAGKLTPKVNYSAISGITPVDVNFRFLSDEAETVKVEFSFGNTLSRDITLVPYFTPIRDCVVRLIPGGGLPDKEFSVRSGQSVLSVAGAGDYPNTEPVREGFDFEAWAMPDDTNEYDFSALVYDNLTIEARWRLRNYTVWFYDGATIIKEVERYHGAEIGFVPDAPVGLSFKEWQIKDDTAVLSSEDIVTSNLQLVAVWEVSLHTVSFAANVADTSSPSSAVDALTDIPYGELLSAQALPQPTRSGYIFDGWYIAGSGGYTPIAGITVDGDVTLTARWRTQIAVYINGVSASTYGITVEPFEGGYVSAADIASLNSLAEAQTPADKVFAYFTTVSNSKTVKYDFSKTVFKGLRLDAKYASTLPAEITLISAYDGVSGQDSFETVAGAQLSAVAEFTAKSGALINAMLSAKPAAEFLFWTTENPAGKAIENLIPFDSTAYITGDVTLYAVYDLAGKLTVTFKEGDWTKTVRVVSGATVSKLELPRPANLDTEYACIWKLNGTAYDFDTPVTESITLVAVWKLQRYEVIYYTEASGVYARWFFKYDDAEDTRRAVNFGITVGVTPPKSGYTFLYWYDITTDGTAGFDFVNTVIDRDYDLYPKYVVTNTDVHKVRIFAADFTDGVEFAVTNGYMLKADDIMAQPAIFQRTLGRKIKTVTVRGTGEVFKLGLTPIYADVSLDIEFELETFRIYWTQSPPAITFPTADRHSTNPKYDGTTVLYWEYNDVVTFKIVIADGYDKDGIYVLAVTSTKREILLPDAFGFYTIDANLLYGTDGRFSGVTIQTNEAVRSIGFAGGTGEPSSPYIIATETQLRYMAAKVNSDTDYAGKNYKLANDIQMVSTTVWTPIGSKGIPFFGTFDGNGYRIYGLKITAAAGGRTDFGLFGGLYNAVIRNLKVEAEISIALPSNSVIDIRDYNVGLLAGAAALADISYVSVSGKITMSNGQSGVPADNYAWMFVGGILGDGQGVSVRYCSAAIEIAVSGGAVDSHSYTGGIIGRATDAIVGYGAYGSLIESCYVSGKVTSVHVAGGIAGDAEYSATIVGCYFTGEVKASRIEVVNAATETTVRSQYSYAGGIVGYFEQYSYIQSSVAFGKVTGDSYAGKLVGTAQLLSGVNIRNLFEVANADCRIEGTATRAYAPGAALLASPIADLRAFLLSRLHFSEADWNLVSTGLATNPLKEEDGKATEVHYIEFVLNGKAVSERGLDHNTLLSELAAKLAAFKPVLKESALFTGWYFDSSMTMPFDGSFVLDSDLMLYGSYVDPSELYGAYEMDNRESYPSWRRTMYVFQSNSALENFVGVDAAAYGYGMVFFDSGSFYQFIYQMGMDGKTVTVTLIGSLGSPHQVIFENGKLISYYSDGTVNATFSEKVLPVYAGLYTDSSGNGEVMAFDGRGNLYFGRPFEPGSAELTFNVGIYSENTDGTFLTAVDYWRTNADGTAVFVRDARRVSLIAAGGVYVYEVIAVPEIAGTYLAGGTGAELVLTSYGHFALGVREGTYRMLTNGVEVEFDFGGGVTAIAVLEKKAAVPGGLKDDILHITLEGVVYLPQADSLKGLYRNSYSKTELLLDGYGTAFLTTPALTASPGLYAVEMLRTSDGSFSEMIVFTAANGIKYRAVISKSAVNALDFGFYTEKNVQVGSRLYLVEDGSSNDPTKFIGVWTFPETIEQLEIRASGEIIYIMPTFSAQFRIGAELRNYIYRYAYSGDKLIFTTESGRRELYFDEYGVAHLDEYQYINGISFEIIGKAAHKAGDDFTAFAGVWVSEDVENNLRSRLEIGVDGTVRLNGTEATDVVLTERVGMEYVEVDTALLLSALMDRVLRFTVDGRTYSVRVTKDGGLSVLTGIETATYDKE